MKKVKALTAAVVAGLITVGAGYAWWTDKLNINSTVNTGNLNVKFVEAKITDYDKGYVSNKVTLVDKQLDFTIDNIYPGAFETLNAKFENNGTIPAVVHNILVNSKSVKNNDLSKLVLKGNVVWADKDGKVKGTYPVNSNAAAVGGLMKNYTLKMEPGDTVKISDMQIILDKDASDAYENDTITMNFSLDFKQHNQ
ncbi:hypothetical protein [Clostridium polynesiense]|uniref:hypothetical protein n=1 Tax=Clostridium polynesiense TaxID=1325933 RepID=UPI00058DF53C|nr:hypothetical protein [Clostridium polynesiense]